MVAWTPRNTIITAVLLSIAIAGVTGLGVTYALHPAPAPQTRNFYMFAVDQGFSAMTITVNRGDTLIIHFYNPTDQAHSFTMGSPYTEDVVLPAMTNTK